MKKEREILAKHHQNHMLVKLEREIMQKTSRDRNRKNIKPAIATLSKGQGNSTAGYPVLVDMHFQVISNGDTSFALKASQVEIVAKNAKLIQSSVNFSLKNVQKLDISEEIHKMSGTEKTNKTNYKSEIALNKISVDAGMDENKRHTVEGAKKSFKGIECLVTYEGMCDAQESAYWVINATSAENRLGKALNNAELISVLPTLSQGSNVSLIVNISEQDILQRKGFSAPFYKGNKRQIFKTLFKKQLAGRYLATTTFLNDAGT